VPYFLPEGRGIIDLLYRGAAGWLSSTSKPMKCVRMKKHAQSSVKNGYDQQVARYAQAVRVPDRDPSKNAAGFPERGQ